MENKWIHQIWLGNRDLPEWFPNYQESWRKFFPDWKYKLWTDDDLLEVIPGMVSSLAFDHSLNVGLRSDILRMEILKKFGGIYADIDFECIRSFSDFLPKECFVYGDEGLYRPGNAILASSMGHPFTTFFLEGVSRYLEGCDLTKPLRHSVQNISGPDALHRALQSWIWNWDTGNPVNDQDGRRIGARYRDIGVMKVETFYPYSYREEKGKHRWFDAVKSGVISKEYPLTCAVHHWGGTWQ